MECGVGSRSRRGAGEGKVSKCSAFRIGFADFYWAKTEPVRVDVRQPGYVAVRTSEFVCRLSSGGTSEESRLNERALDR